MIVCCNLRKILIPVKIIIIIIIKKDQYRLQINRDHILKGIIIFYPIKITKILNKEVRLKVIMLNWSKCLLKL